MAKGKNSAVAKTNGGAVTLSKEAMEAMAGTEGHEGLGAQDFATPFLKILQSNSGAVDEGSDTYVEGAKIGNFMNSGNQKLYPAGETLFLPVACNTHWVEWVPNGGGFVRQFEPGELPPGNIRDKITVELENGNEARYTHSHFGFVIGPDRVPDQVVFACDKSNITPSKKLNSALQGSRVDGKSLNRFAHVIVLDTERRENDQGVWRRLQWKGLRVIDFEDPIERGWFEAGKTMHSLVKEGNIKVDDAQREEGTTAGAKPPSDDIPPASDSDLHF